MEEDLSQTDDDFISHKVKKRERILSTATNACEFAGQWNCFQLTPPGHTMSFVYIVNLIYKNTNTSHETMKTAVNIFQVLDELTIAARRF